MLSEEDTKRALTLMLFRQTELAKNDLMTKAEALVDDHFKQTYQKGNALTSSQLNNLEGVSFTTFCKADIRKFIQNQAGKENPNKPEENKWTHNGLDERLLEAIDNIATDNAEFVNERLTERAQEEKIDVGDVTTWLTTERKAEVEINMVRSFLTYFATYYNYVRKKKGFDAAEEDER